MPLWHRLYVFVKEWRFQSEDLSTRALKGGFNSETVLGCKCSLSCVVECLHSTNIINTSGLSGQAHRLDINSPLYSLCAGAWSLTRILVGSLLYYVLDRSDSKLHFEKWFHQVIEWALVNFWAVIPSILQVSLVQFDAHQ